jgi:hypothetical protein
MKLTGGTIASRINTFKKFSTYIISKMAKVSELKCG